MDASIYLDNQYIGSPTDLPDGISIEDGDHLLDVVRSGYVGYEQSIKANGGESLPIQVELRQTSTNRMPFPRSAAISRSDDLTSQIKGLRVRIFCVHSLRSQGETLRSRLAELGATVILEAPRVGTEIAGVVFPRPRILAGRAVKALASDLRSLPLIEASDVVGPEITVWMIE